MNLIAIDCGSSRNREIVNKADIANITISLMIWICVIMSETLLVIMHMAGEARNII